MEDFNDIQMDLPDEPVPQVQQPKTPGVFGVIFNRMTSDMKFVGIFTIIYGALSCLSIVGAIIGIPLIFAGIRLREAADQYTMFQSTNDNMALRRAFEKQGRYFNIIKILIIIALVLTLIYIIVFISMIGTFFSAMSGTDFS